MRSKKASLLKTSIFLTIILSLILTLSFTDQSLANPGVEVVEKRTLNSKTFDNGDGTLTFQAHMGHIHYVDKKTGKLRECDTTLIDIGDKWIQSRASYHCEIPKYADENFIFTDVFEEKSQTLTMRPLARHILGEIDNSDGWVNKRVLYRNAFGKGLHLRVTAGNVGLFKEVIIDESPNPLKDLSFDFEISLPSEEHVYAQDTRLNGRAVQVALANHTVTGNKQILIGQVPIEGNSFSYIRQIRIWDSGDNAINGRAQFYRMGSNLYFRKIVPKEFLATATYPVYTDDTASYYSGAGDGYVAGGAANNNWDTAHHLLVGQVADYTSAAANGLVIASRLRFDNAVAIYRGFFPIDATDLPDTATITAASLFFGIYSKQNGDNDGYDYIAVVGETTQADPDLLAGADYDTCGTVHNPTLGSAKYDITDIATGQYLEMVLNATGISWIKKSGTGDNAYSRFGIREGHDIDDHPYAGDLDTWNYITGPPSDYAGTAYDPYLSVTYTVVLTTHYVDKYNTNPVSPYLDWDTAATNIQNAINVCDAGTVIVRKAAYSAITMKSYVDVVCEDPLDRPTINGSPPVTFNGVNNCTLDGFIIPSGQPGYGQIILDGLAGVVANVTIKDCKLSGLNSCPGIYLQGSVGSTIEGCEIGPVTFAGIKGDFLKPAPSPIVIRRCIVHEAGQGGLGAGIFLVGDGEPLQVTIGGTGEDLNQIYDNRFAGIRLTDFGAGSNVTIDNNDIHDNGIIAGVEKAGIRIENVALVTIKNNHIHRHTGKAGISIEGPNSNVTIGENNEIDTNYAGICLRTANSKPVLIKGNYIHSNTHGGIYAKVSLDGLVTITENEINQNTWGGIGINGTCTMVITKNNIHHSVSRGGIHTRTGASTLIIRQNKVHHNEGAFAGGGIDVRHAYGIIENNLVYRNGRGGIRFWVGISEIVNNTVVWNGNGDYGGGIIYDDLTGAINDPPSGNPPGPLVIKNNICAYNAKAGIRACFDNTGGERDYNLLYDNWYGHTILGYNYGDCSWTGWPGCKKRQLGNCWPVASYEIFAKPEFETGLDNYHLDPGPPSPAIGTGEGGVDMGCYGGDYPIDDAEIP